MKKPKKEIYPPKSPGKASKQQQLPDDVSEITEAEDGTSLISVDESKVAKAVSSQTNASAKPPRNSKPMQTPDEAAALEAAMIERNTAKERHRQQKAAKKGEDVPAAAEPMLVSPSPTKDSKEGTETKALPPVKSPAKLLPPSEAQRQAQLKIDRGPSTGKPKKAEDNPDSPDVEREKAATQLQRMARGRLARRRTQSNDTDSKHEEGVPPKKKKQPVSSKPSTGATAEEKEADDTVETEEEVRRQHAAAKSVQKVARGKIVRSNLSTTKAAQQLNSAESENLPSEEVATEATAAAGDGEGESGVQADGAGYAESLLMQQQP